MTGWSLQEQSNDRNASHYNWVEKVAFCKTFKRALTQIYQLLTWHGASRYFHQAAFEQSGSWMRGTVGHFKSPSWGILLNRSWSCLGASLSLAATDSDVSFERGERATGHRKTQHKGSKAQVWRETCWLHRVCWLSVTVFQTLLFMWTFIRPRRLGVLFFLNWFTKVMPNALLVPTTHSALKFFQISERKKTFCPITVAVLNVFHGNCLVGYIFLPILLNK